MSTELNKTLVVVGTGSIVMTTLYLYNSLALSGIAFVFWMFLVFIVEFLWVDTQSNENEFPTELNTRKAKIQDCQKCDEPPKCSAAPYPCNIEIKKSSNSQSNENKKED